MAYGESSGHVIRDVTRHVAGGWHCMCVTEVFNLRALFYSLLCISQLLLSVRCINNCAHTHVTHPIATLGIGTCDLGKCCTIETAYYYW